MIRPTSSGPARHVRQGTDSIRRAGHREPVDQVSLGSTPAEPAPTRPQGRGGWKETLQLLKEQMETGAASAVAGPLAATAVRLHEGHTDDLKVIADRAMADKGLATDFSPAVLEEVARLKGPARPDGNPHIRDLRHLLWCSIDNGRLNPQTLELENASRDLDQLTVAERLPNGNVRIYVAIADVDSLVPKGSAVDQHAMINTRTCYTADKIYPMLPERLSTDLTSLNPGEDRLAIIKQFDVTPEGKIAAEDMYRAYVHNHAKMAYDSVAAWIEGKEGPYPPQLQQVPGLAEQIRLQDEVAQKLKAQRFEHGAIQLEDRETRADIQDGQVLALHLHQRNRATELIENLMVAANGVTARFLEKQGLPSFRRVVRTPEKWDRIVALARERGTNLPRTPDSKALNDFLVAEKARDPLRFPDLSLAVVKLLGRGEYVVEFPDRPAPGHFCLAVDDYAHSTAPNRRGPDLVGQRLEKAAILARDTGAAAACPYTDEELEELAKTFTRREADIDKVERQVSKSAAAKLLAHHIGEIYEGLITGASEKGTWVRLLEPPVEGKVVQGARGLEVGDRVRVKLLKVNIERGFIDFQALR
jgi:exoribonuclease-2